MKYKIKQVALVAALIFTINHIQAQTQSNQITPQQLAGKYKVDLSSLVTASRKANKGKPTNDLDALLETLVLASVDIHMSFYKNGKGAIYFSGKGIDFIAAFSEKPFKKLIEFTYQINTQQVLSIRTNEGKNPKYENVGTVVPVGGGFDYLKIKIKDKDLPQGAFVLFERVKG